MMKTKGEKHQEIKNKDERIERLPSQRGEASNSVGVLSRLAGSEAMFVFLCDFAGVLSRSDDSRAPPKIENYTLKILSS